MAHTLPQSLHTYIRLAVSNLDALGGDLEFHWKPRWALIVRVLGVGKWLVYKANMLVLVQLYTSKFVISSLLWNYQYDTSLGPAFVEWGMWYLCPLTHPSTLPSPSTLLSLLNSTFASQPPSPSTILPSQPSFPLNHPPPQPSSPLNNPPPQPSSPSTILPSLPSFPSTILPFNHPPPQPSSPLNHLPLSTILPSPSQPPSFPLTLHPPPPSSHTWFQQSFTWCRSFQNFTSVLLYHYIIKAQGKHRTVWDWTQDSLGLNTGQAGTEHRTGWDWTQDRLGLNTGQAGTGHRTG